jgi:hypothetical protein
MPPSNRLKQTLEVGNVLALFPILKDWSTDELKALIQDANDLCAATQDEIDKAWKCLAFQPTVLLSPNKQFQELAHVCDEGKLKVAAALSEICSVAMFYLEQRGVEIKLPGDEQ